MIRTGEILTNPISGETLIFRQTAADTDGELVEVECIVSPGGAVAGAHVHPAQEERFEVLQGQVGFRAGRTMLIATPGEVVVVPAGTVHRFWNAGETDARFVCQVRPALEFEALIETMFGLARDGKTNRKGLPNPLRMAVIAHAHRRDVRAPYVPALMQSAGLAVGAALGRAVGYSASYQPAEGIAVGEPVVQPS
ncbi:MAG TPA: cupin domain-containing protein [Gaiellales bacterium]|nr:cupin domain-containing protein [Gaiellales bacterium]